MCDFLGIFDHLKTLETGEDSGFRNRPFNIGDSLLENSISIDPKPRKVDIFGCRRTPPQKSEIDKDYVPRPKQRACFSVGFCIFIGRLNRFLGRLVQTRPKSRRWHGIPADDDGDL